MAGFVDGMNVNVERPTRSVRTAHPRGIRGHQVDLPDGADLLLIGGQGSLLARGDRPSVALDALMAWVREHFVVHEWRGAWSAHNYEPVDDLPWIGPTSSVTPPSVHGDRVSQMGDDHRNRRVAYVG